MLLLDQFYFIFFPLYIYVNYSLGYIKDLIAFFTFALLYYLVYNYDLHLNKSFVLRLLSLGFLIDGYSPYILNFIIKK